MRRPAMLAWVGTAECTLLVTVARNLLIIAYYILRDDVCYRDLGPDYFDTLNPEGLRRRLTKRLEGLGFKVTLQPLPQLA